jgi:hypothetical protein
MSAALHTATPTLVAVTVLSVACGGEERHAATETSTSARFVESWTYRDGEEIRREEFSGVFDWSKRVGSAEGEDGYEIRQIGNDCYENNGGELWRHWRLDEAGDLCPVIPPSPALPLQELLPGARIEPVGTEVFDGVKTTVFRAVVDEEAAFSLPALDDGPIEVWRDESAGLVRRWHESSDPSESLDQLQREFHDVGLEVHVGAPDGEPLFEVGQR